MSARVHTTRHFFSSACLWAAPSIRSPVRSKAKRQPARGSRDKRLSRRWRAHRKRDAKKAPLGRGGLLRAKLTRVGREFGFPTHPSSQTAMFELEVFVSAFAAWPAALRRPASPATLAQPPTLN